jgi:hypothetical protein
VISDHNLNDRFELSISRSLPFSDRLVVAVSRRPGDEIHPWPPNGDLRPLLAIEAQDANGRLWVIPA